MMLFWAPQTRSQRAIWMLEEAGLDYEMEFVDMRVPDREDSEKFNNVEPNRGRSGWGDFDLLIDAFDQAKAAG